MKAIQPIGLLAILKKIAWENWITIFEKEIKRYF
jgi:hypothetical protein